MRVGGSVGALAVKWIQNPRFYPGILDWAWGRVPFAKMLASFGVGGPTCSASNPRPRGFRAAPVIQMTFTQAVTVFLLEGEAAELGNIRSVFERVFPEATFISCNQFSEASSGPAGALEILVIGNTSNEDRAAATEVLDEEELPRWAVFEHGGPENGDDTRIALPTEGASDAVLERLVTLGVEHHLLRKKCLKMAGDLQTIGSRMCHDLRTPLTCLQTFVYIAGASGNSEFPEELLTSASTSTEELALLIDRVSAIAKSWGTPRSPGRVDVGKSLDAAWQKVSRRFPDHGVRLNAPPSLPAVVGVSTWVESVWEICLAEVVRHMAGSGSGIEVRWGDAPPEPRFEIQVPRIEGQQWTVEPFHLLGTRRDRGNVALSLAGRLVQRMGGEFGCQMAGDEATCIYFTLPGAESLPN